MTLMPKALLLIAALGLAACNNPDRFGAGGAGANGAGGFVDTNGLGDPNDPTSIAYFPKMGAKLAKKCPTYRQSALKGKIKTKLKQN